ncbi:Probable inorganic polyphosphate/ATP-NAD kinase [Candidatus Blochmanniella vafra str. BVAF]|uniref:NAD kinase n=1 Tax=Blochmanniella vafra (strain BVAF) TaxID=859654 RepID=E8Q6G0_BLOVB|nr:NAD(+) kinase [Candidatus Blochmannia vafer]ADV33929.1 Probable inorganic polyphosphate/ATP-NAD kinase [Candidatus Blochmannia vafer str. BVAF]
MTISIFHTIGLIGNTYYPQAIHIYYTLYNWLHKKGIKVIIEQHTANLLHARKAIIGNLKDIGNLADLAIIIGGDGNILRAANILIRYNIKIIGINLGTVGFLADLHPKSALAELSKVLTGNFTNEKRFLLDVKIKRNNTVFKLGTAINEVILHTNTIRQLIKFKLYINNKFIFSSRSDGLIIATPTGSTAYSLSAGGPIVTPAINAVILIPICPHILSSRPIVVDNKSIISLKFSQFISKIRLGCDNQAPINIYGKKEILIQRSNYFLDLIHPNTYNYFKNLTIKLGWSKK